MDKAKIMKLCQQIGLVAIGDKKHYPALHSDFDFINDSQMDIFREVTAPPKTNADRIRQMTDEELIELVNSSVCRYTDCLDNDCEECGRKWVIKEVREDAGTE